MLPHADYLRRAGYNALLFDLRASGESGGGAVTLGALERGDAIGALDYLEQRGDVDMGRVGMQEIDNSFEHFIGLPAFPFAPITVWIVERRTGLDADDIAPIDEVRALAGRPLLIIDDEIDESIAPGSARAVYEAAGEPKRYWLAPGAIHVGGHDVAPAAYEEQVLAFWAETFR
jgi:fermentation-respiration switch protein FrsA (DUF1100 family)